MSSRVNEVNGENLQDPPIKNPGYANAETPKPIWIKFCMVVDIPDIVTYTNFGDHRLRGFWVAGGHISPSPTDFHRRPYNTLALPCERVINVPNLKSLGSSVTKL